MKVGDTMKTVVPDYYKDFQCIASACRHSCCIGWEIDIDEKSLGAFERVDGEIGIQLKNNICFEPQPHFTLTEDEHCPFLTEQKLCRLILDLGEDKLCDICRDHPRFRNYLSDRTELGLGLCCEEAARIVLEHNGSIELEIADDGGTEQPGNLELELLNERKELFKTILDRSKSLNERIAAICYEYGINRSSWHISDWAKRYLTLERLDEAWTKVLMNLASVGDLHFIIAPEYENSYENVLHYFIYRHFLSDDFEDSYQALYFCILSLYIIFAADEVFRIQNGGIGLQQRIEHLRLYSSEIEYSDENIEKIMEWIK